MSMRRFIGVAMCGLVLETASAPAGDDPCSCPADVDGSGTVGFADVLAVLADWGPCEGCDGDVDGDGTVGFEDLLAVLAAWGPCVFDYADRQDPEANQIGLEVLGADGPLLVPDELYDRIDRDLDLIRAFEPALADQTHSPAFAPDHLIVKKIPKAPPESYDRLNACLRIVDERNLFGDWYVLTFPGSLNAVALSVIYAELDSIEFAEPDGIIGRQNFWEPTPLEGGTWRWDVDDGYCDCFDGCDCHFLYVFEVAAGGAVTLVDYQEIFSACCAF